VRNTQFNEQDHLAWSRFMLASLAAIAVRSPGDDGRFTERAREQLSRAWAGLGAQGVEGAMLTMILTLESMGCEIRSTQTSPENSEIIVEALPGTAMLDGLSDRFGIKADADDWYALMSTDRESVDQIYDILGAIADGADVEYIREQTEDGDVRLVLRAW
jgi:hypothetical protein